MEGWSKAKIDCYKDFKAQMIKEGFMIKQPRKPRKEKPDDYTVQELELFNEFWNSGIRKAGDKQKTKRKYIALVRAFRGTSFVFDSAEYTFSRFILLDIEQRLKKEQLGFKEMHPYTYLNGERWNDAMPEKIVKLLKLPSPQDQQGIDKLVREYNLPKASTEKDYFEYHKTLKEYIEKHQIKPKGGDDE